MHWVIALSIVLLIGGLAGLFVLTARAIRRDMDDRFDRVRTRLETEANNVVGRLNEHERS